MPLRLGFVLFASNAFSMDCATASAIGYGGTVLQRVARMIANYL